IVALEAMAANTPVVASQVGGLSEIIDHDKTGVIVYPNNSDSLAWGILRVLEDNNYANRLRFNALRKISEAYNWENIAKKTFNLYEQVLEEYEAQEWKPSSV
ncbi:glycosyltransferase family 4 protein, partial [Candidatus Bathyarchaeota archaeon]|nr:glycosyltransferase family 4 protein [Candidatus Bathyarchaeota archaeon]